MEVSSSPRRRQLTAAKAAQIKKIAHEQPLFQDQIGAMLNLNQGRVSEVLSGKRFPNVAAAT